MQHDSDLGQPQPRVVLSGDTEDGRLRPAQDIFARYLRSRGVENPFIIDIGVGDAAVTVRKDLVAALVEAGFHQATIIGLDADRIRVQTARSTLAHTQRQGLIPSGFQVHFHLADITALSSHDYQIKNVVARLHERGIAPSTQADLVHSANLISCMSREDVQISEQAMAEITKVDGIIALGSGGAEAHTRQTSLNYKLFRPFRPDSPLGSLPFDADPYFHKRSHNHQEQRKNELLQEVYRVGALKSEADIATEVFRSLSGPQTYSRL